MIKSEQFYRAFAEGFAKSCPDEPKIRRRGKIPKYVAQTPAGRIDFWFKVNGKASAIPYQPGEFWPVVEAATLRYNDRDCGDLSWYQYAAPSEQLAMLELQRVVMHKVAAQEDIEPALWKLSRDINLRFMSDSIAEGFRVGFPHTRLCYLDEDDSFNWGLLLGKTFPDWVERFSAAPETLEGYMWRVHWNEGIRA